jgi:hypothetical protein
MDGTRINKVLVTVRDSGPGLDPQKLEINNRKSICETTSKVEIRPFGFILGRETRSAQTANCQPHVTRLRRYSTVKILLIGLFPCCGLCVTRMLSI